ncbi:MAG TPA: hypothetical protein PK720_03805, partial [bacterium]|nr:hypothetical protein [bacterium]
MPQIDSNLLAYISESLKQGNTQESTRKTLLEAGWQLEEINQAFISLTPPVIISKTDTVAEESNYSSKIFSEEQPKAIRQEIIITRILNFIRFVCLIIIFYFLWKIKTSYADIPWQDINSIYK